MGSSLTEKAVSGASWNTASIVGSQATNILVTIYLANRILPEIFGLFAMVAVVIQLLSVLKDLGLNMAIIQKQVVTPEDTSTVFWTNMVISFVLGGVLFFLSGAVATFYQQDKLIMICKVLSIPFFLNGLGATHFALANKNLKFKAISIIQFVSILGAGGIACLHASVAPSVWVLVMKQILQVAIANVLILFFVRTEIKWFFSFALLKSLLNFSIFYSATQFYSSLATKSDEVFLGKFAGESALGLYANAYKIILLPLTMLKGQVVKVLFPMLSGIQDDKVRVKGAVLKTSGLLAFLGFFAVFLLILVSEELVGLLLGSEWNGMGELIQYLGVFFLFEVSVFPGAILLSQGRSSEYFWLMLFAKTLTMVMMGLGAYYGGAIGLIKGMVLSGIILFIPHLYFSGKYIGASILELLREMALPLVLALVSFSTVYLSSTNMFSVESEFWSFVVKGALFFTFYFGGALLLKMERLTELRLILSKVIK